MMSFFNYTKGSKKGCMEREGFFYYEIHMKCAGVIHFTLLSITSNVLPCDTWVFCRPKSILGDLSRKWKRGHHSASFFKWTYLWNFQVDSTFSPRNMVGSLFLLLLLLLLLSLLFESLLLLLLLSILLSFPLLAQVFHETVTEIRA